jgi:hypothetical protein
MMRSGPSHIWPLNITEDGDLSTGLAFSSTISPKRVADMMSTEVGAMTMHLIYRRSFLQESSSRCEFHTR